MTAKNSVTFSFCAEKCFDNSRQSMLFQFITSILYSILVMGVVAEFCYGQTCPDAKTDSLIQIGIAQSIQHNYSQAESIFQNLTETYPDHPIGYFFMAAMLQSKMIDYETDRWSEDFRRYIRLAIDKAENRKTQDLWAMFYHGSALCYLAFYEGRNGDYLKAINHGFSGIAILKKIVNIDPEFHDAYFGIGSYQYWRSQKTRLLNWLPLISDGRAEGIELVRRSVELGRYTRYIAMSELIWILLDAGEADEAYAWAVRGLKQFPQSRFFLWGAAKSAYAMENFAAAASYFQNLLNSIVNSPMDNDYNEFLCRLKLAQCLEKLGKLAEASHQIAMIDSLALSEKLKNKLKKQRSELTQLKSRLANLAKIESPIASSVLEHQLADKQRRQ
ncbi:MAG: hypothetical protein ONB31_14170 [candidate division KSB1 bacterium]|nr:hypothetical protein [candidate division KSB1 bacterium]MDZ7336727.1 hypothetical protein [candidate division KSB1 bacterium]MDZ7358425.1 hypothetical protein [candidate division KSB1 bacterium]